VWTGHCYSAFPLFYQNSFQLVQMHHKHVDVEVSISSRYKLGHLSQYSDKAMGWTIGSSIASRHREFFSLPLHPDWLWGPPSLLSNWHQGLLAGDTAARTWRWPLMSI
jgi:hypothetical protein